MYWHMVKALSLDSLFLSLRTSSQNLVVVKPSVARAKAFLDDATAATAEAVSAIGVNISAIDLSERLGI
jgi:hypothetical protein